MSSRVAMTLAAFRVWIFVVLGLALTGCALMIVMIATGYMPATGFGHNAAHSLRFGLTAGLTAGMAFTVAVWMVVQ